MRIALAGLGNVGKAFLQLLEDNVVSPPWLLVGVSDTSGVWTDDRGLSPRHVLLAKASGQGFAPGNLWRAKPDVFLDARAMPLREPSSAVAVLEALQQGIHCVLAQKGPLVQAWPTLRQWSDASLPNLPALRFGAAVGSALPSYNVARREFQGAQLFRIEGLLNITCQRVLGLLTEGLSVAEAVERLRKLGMTEKEPRQDLEGIDSAAKLLILANALWNTSLTLDDVKTEGLSGLDERSVQQAASEGKKLSLLASATRDAEEVRLKVEPRALPSSHPLYRARPNEQAVAFYSRIHGALTMMGESLGPSGTAATLFRDVLEISATRY